MRITQLYGLNKRAKDFLEENCYKTPIKICPTCGHKTGGEKIFEKYDDKKELGINDDGPELYKYKLRNGKFVYEIIQDVIYSSGPCIFLCLSYTHNIERAIEELKWTEEEKYQSI